MGRRVKEGTRIMRKSEFALWILLIFAAFGAGNLTKDLWNGQSSAADKIAEKTKSENQKLYKLLNLFGDVLERVKADYVEKPDDNTLIESAINGMLTSLDPHSAYLNSKHFKDMQVQTTGQFGGLGIEVTMEKGVVKVVSPIEGTPAEKAGLMSGDYITHLDGESISGLTLEKAVEKMRGRVKTPIVLTVIRKGKDDSFDVKIYRDVIRINPVKSRAEGEIAYIRVTQFNEQTHANLKTAIAKLKKEIGSNLKGFVIDLRNNPGGLLDQAVAVSDTFLEKGIIVVTRGRRESETKQENAKKGDLTDGKKIVVLINGGSASASEIVAGALKDHDRATIIGTRSFGKGSVQTIIPLGSSGALRLTTARYYTPKRESIQAKGIVPTIVVEQELPEELKKKVRKPGGEASLRGHLKSEGGKESSGSSSFVPKEKEKDTQLQYALKLLRGTLKAEDTASKDTKKEEVSKN